MHVLVFALLFEHHAIPCTPYFPCTDPGFFVRGGGGPGHSDQKALTTFFSSPQLILLESNGLFRRKLSFFKVPEGGPTFSRGVQLFPGGSNCLYPIETHITCDFPGGSVPSDPPLDPHLLSRPTGDSFFPFSRRWVVLFSFI